MSDREVVLEVIGIPERYSHRKQRVLTMFMDGETGTWRIFIQPHDANLSSIDLAYDNLVELRDGLSRVIEDIARDPVQYDARIRATWDE